MPQPALLGPRAPPPPSEAVAAVPHRQRDDDASQEPLALGVHDEPTEAGPRALGDRRINALTPVA
jgi:hypothetical protein